MHSGSSGSAKLAKNASLSGFESDSAEAVFFVGADAEDGFRDMKSKPKKEDVFSHDCGFAQSVLFSKMQEKKN
jgi:hypothetical protein